VLGAIRAAAAPSAATASSFAPLLVRCGRLRARFGQCAGRLGERVDPRALLAWRPGLLTLAGTRPLFLAPGVVTSGLLAPGLLTPGLVAPRFVAA
jgi:hypothetical protein